MSRTISELDVRTALADVEHRTWILRKSIWDYIKLTSNQIQNLPVNGEYNLDQKRLNSETDRELENILLNAKQWYKAISRTAIPRDKRKAIKAVLDTDLQQTIECLRDMREHWEQTRRYFENSELQIPEAQTNVRWFKQKYPNANPWSSGMSVGIGYYIAGPEVLNLHNLLVEADRVDSIMQSS
ncbi:MAG: hypothetical protein JWO35_225 [Candidatus Saccharibacteria bacterium]|nr:hypothetical protein [Candidatus Saccharibacteria bacterium]